jgi:putative ABC transport system substrate-binding protein
MVTNGGYATYGINYESLGRIAGEQAVAILKGEKTAADTPIQWLSADDCTEVVNLKIAKELGLSTDKADYEGAQFIEE